jgi:hypothetical protein
MIAKLLGMVARDDRLTSIGATNAGELVSLTDTQLDMVAGGFAQVSASVTNANALVSFSVSDDPSARLASFTANFTIADGPPHSGSVSAAVGPNM